MGRGTRGGEPRKAPAEQEDTAAEQPQGKPRPARQPSPANQEPMGQPQSPQRSGWSQQRGAQEAHNARAASVEAHPSGRTLRRMSSGEEGAHSQGAVSPRRSVRSPSSRTPASPTKGQQPQSPQRAGQVRKKFEVVPRDKKQAQQPAQPHSPQRQGCVARSLSAAATTEEQQEQQQGHGKGSQPPRLKVRSPSPRATLSKQQQQQQQAEDAQAHRAAGATRPAAAEADEQQQQQELAHADAPRRSGRAPKRRAWLIEDDSEDEAQQQQQPKQQQQPQQQQPKQQQQRKPPKQQEQQRQQHAGPGAGQHRWHAASKQKQEHSGHAEDAQPMHESGRASGQRASGPGSGAATVPEPAAASAAPAAPPNAREASPSPGLPAAEPGAPAAAAAVVPVLLPPVDSFLPISFDLALLGPGRLPERSLANGYHTLGGPGPNGGASSLGDDAADRQLQLQQQQQQFALLQQQLAAAGSSGGLLAVGRSSRHGEEAPKRGRGRGRGNWGGRGRGRGKPPLPPDGYGPADMWGAGSGINHDDSWEEGPAGGPEARGRGRSRGRGRGRGRGGDGEGDAGDDAPPAKRAKKGQRGVVFLEQPAQQLLRSFLTKLAIAAGADLQDENVFPVAGAAAAAGGSAGAVQPQPGQEPPVQAAPAAPAAVGAPAAATQPVAQPPQVLPEAAAHAGLSDGQQQQQQQLWQQPAPSPSPEPLQTTDTTAAPSRRASPSPSRAATNTGPSAELAAAADALVAALRSRQTLSQLWQLPLHFAAPRRLLSSGATASLELFWKDVESDVRATIDSYDFASNPTVRRKRLESQAEQLLEELREAGEQLLSKGGHLPQPGAAAKPATVQRVALPRSIINNHEPYKHGDWDKAMPVPRAYELLTEYANRSNVPEEREVLAWKLKTRREDGSTEFRITHAAELGEEGVRVRELELARQVAARNALRLGVDVVEADTWGMDCYTRKNVVDAVLEGGAFAHLRYADEQQGQLAAGQKVDGRRKRKPVPDAADFSKAEVDAAYDWVERVFLPVVNKQGADGWDMMRTVEAIRKQALREGDEPSKLAADELQRRIQLAGYPYFRLHPKGRGIVCARQQGLPPYTFVEEYFGELHTGWRWFELQDAIKKVTGEELPEFYNIQLERPRDDPDGYDVLFVDAAFAGSFASRMSHSCTPNCRAVIVSTGGKLTVVLYTLREIGPGEELCFDYQCVTESEKEFKEALCLCGSRNCRGAFLYYATSSAFSQVMSKDLTFLHRQVMLLRACTEPLTQQDHARLDRHGVRSSALGNGMPGNERVPDWLGKWAALCLEFVEHEERLMPQALMDMAAIPPYDAERAASEALGIRDTRLQNIVITLDKVKHFLRQRGQNRGPIMKLLSDQEVTDYLWNGDKSVAWRTVRAAAAALAGAQVGKALEACSSQEDVEDAIEQYSDSSPELGQLLQLLLQRATDPDSARQLLLTLEGQLRVLDLEQGGGHTFMADVVHMYATTRVWFTAERDYKGFSSPPLQIHADMLKLHKSMAQRLGPGSGPSRSIHNSAAAAAASGASGSAAGGESGADAGEEESPDDGDDATAAAASSRPRATAPAKRSGRRSALSTVGLLDDSVLCKRYGPWFMWGQLSGWFKQSVYDPTASLSAERRGTLSLPDVECCYTNTRRYNAKERQWVLDHILKQPSLNWKVNGVWNFKNEAKVYGSPMMDAFWDEMTQGIPRQVSLDKIVAGLKAAKLPWGSGAGGNVGGNGRRRAGSITGGGEGANGSHSGSAGAGGGGHAAGGASARANGVQRAATPAAAAAAGLGGIVEGLPGAEGFGLPYEFDASMLADLPLH